MSGRKMMTKINPWGCIPEHIDIGNIEEAKSFSENKLSVIRKQLSPTIERYMGNCDILIGGSLGRKEALPSSDIDGFVLSDESCEADVIEKILENLKGIASSPKLNLEMAPAGAFSTITKVNELLENYGGRDDSNESLTRRMTVLLEGVGINTRSGFVNDCKKRILHRYLKDLLDDQTRGPIFLINDVIRYYRTIAVDYEYKKTEVGKPWAVRLIKFRHSRKILYFGALLPLLQSINESERIGWLEEQFINNTPLERIILLLNSYGRKEDWDILKYYNYFVGFFKDNKQKDNLNKIQFDQRDSDNKYLALRDNSRNLRDALHNFVKSVDHWQETFWKYGLS